MSHSLLKQKMLETAALLQECLSEILPVPQGLEEDSLLEAMRYSALSPGKRIRPFLTLTSATICNGHMPYALRVASAIELIHTYSLIHDDLPALDNDDYRRGIPSCHNKFGEATAILAGDGLLTYAFEVLADQATHHDGQVRAELVQLVAQAIGCKGMIGGQAIDLSAQSINLDFNSKIRLQNMKTAQLFGISCEAGAIISQADMIVRKALRQYGVNVGIAFQIRDDVLDGQKNVAENETSSLEQERLIQYGQQMITEGVKCVEIFNDDASLLRELAHFVSNREY
ncbi:polyprenyl synthetase family protein [Rickettsiales endosymbiont of Peranema trichophorum]|uniref:polyprenyl synthetase family protein n=1 Tax=Rickettsiales endosymbiont of Peranema trichophorum TaxID=2486577 RepID=UPI0010236C4B|nr:polyprenyl synthetase family protein [Rickettsiales endosymbiont of Peranema trichophorum]RZI47679.1 polyprenyl synthetase family protein [Rickettsiales endosymbiont of Peranema trichophorum]